MCRLRLSCVDLAPFGERFGALQFEDTAAVEMAIQGAHRRAASQDGRPHGGPDQMRFYLNASSINHDPSELPRGHDAPAHPAIAAWQDRAAAETPTHRMQFVDMPTYLPDDILARVDRASMAAGVEARVPLLDHRVVSFARGLSGSQRIRGWTGKWLLRHVLQRHVPRHFFERPKSGFTILIDDWLRGPLRDRAEALFSPSRLREATWLEPGAVRRMWQSHLSGRRNLGHQLWTLFVLQLWIERWVSE